MNLESRSGNEISATILFLYLILNLHLMHLILKALKTLLLIYIYIYIIYILDLLNLLRISKRSYIKCLQNYIASNDYLYSKFYLLKLAI